MVHIRKLPQDTDAYMFEAYSDGLLGWFVTCLGALFEPALRRRSGQLKEAIESEYPRLLKLFLNISGRQQTLAKPVEAFLTPFETAYLGRCLTRLFDRVNSTFLGISASEGNGGNLPRLIDAERMVQTAATELAHSAAVQHELFCKVGFLFISLGYLMNLVRSKFCFISFADVLPGHPKRRENGVPLLS